MSIPRADSAIEWLLFVNAALPFFVTVRTIANRHDLNNTRNPFSHRILGRPGQILNSAPRLVSVAPVLLLKACRFWARVNPSFHKSLAISGYSLSLKFMRLEFEPNVTAFPLIEDDLFDYPVKRDFALLLKKGIAAAQNGERDHARELLAEASQIDPKEKTPGCGLHRSAITLKNCLLFSTVCLISIRRMSVPPSSAPRQKLCSQKHSSKER